VTARHAALAAALLWALPAGAGVDPFEIQVYGPDLNEPGQFSLELHLNYAWGGSTAPAYPGQAPLSQAGHYSLEAAVGVLEWLDLGAYLLTFSAPDFGYQYGGWKVRAKMVVPRRLTGAFFFGLNVEVGRVPLSVDSAAWGTEFRPILGWSDDWLYVAVNPILGFALDGPDAFRVEFGPCAKLEVNTQLWFGVGLEYYSSMGFLDALPPASQFQQILFAVLDLMPPKGGEESPWELNFGVGRALTAATPQQWEVKAIVGRSF